jgi:MerR family transcriptional regulator, heat shock protein HspR
MNERDSQARAPASGIPADEPVFQISIVSRMVGIHQQTIRQYERIGLIRPARSEGNTRLFSHRDVDRLRQVVRLVTDLGVNLAGAEVILRMGRQIEELRAELLHARREVARLRGEAPADELPGDVEPGIRDEHLTPRETHGKPSSDHDG